MQNTNLLLKFSVSKILRTVKEPIIFNNQIFHRHSLKTIDFITRLILLKLGKILNKKVTRRLVIVIQIFSLKLFFYPCDKNLQITIFRFQIFNKKMLDI